GGITKEKFQSDSEVLTNQVAVYEDKVMELSVQAEKSQHDNEAKLTKRLIELTGIQELTRELVLEFVSEIKVHNPEHIEIIWKYGDAFEQMLSGV
ncbi:MAG: DUF4368 domain-containing protein, partial [Oscillospiraceae bacterium]|nr:DUF4368 domain-containing protein [Oscillospiraceae bacterium]